MKLTYRIHSRISRPHYDRKHFIYSQSCCNHQPKFVKNVNYCIFIKVLISQILQFSIQSGNRKAFVVTFVATQRMWLDTTVLWTHDHQKPVFVRFSVTFFSPRRPVKYFEFRWQFHFSKTIKNLQYLQMLNQCRHWNILKSE